MKNGIVLMLMMATGLLPAVRASAQVEIITDVIKDAIMAVDLGIQKVQTKTIGLQEAQQLAENTMEQLHLTDITNWVQDQLDLYSEYYQELWQVKSVLGAYDKVVAMIDKQVKLLKDYQTAYSAVRRDPHFSSSELAYIGRVYGGILSQSAENIKGLESVIRSLVTQMDDGERLELIDGTGTRIEGNCDDFYRFTQQNVLLSLERAKDQSDLDQIKLLYGIQ